MSSHPTLLNSCTWAATAAEARYRINSPVASSEARVIALDRGAIPVLQQVAEQPWQRARFFLFDTVASSGNGSGSDAVLKSLDGYQSRLSEQLQGADLAVMVATSDDGSDGAAAIGQACRERSIMTAGVVLSGSEGTDATVASLRSHARIMIVSHNSEDVAEVLSALRA